MVCLREEGGEPPDNHLLRLLRLRRRRQPLLHLRLQLLLLL